MVEQVGPTCAGCGRRPEGGRLMCRTCWAAVPAARRRAVDAAWKAYARRPGSLELRNAYDVAVAEAVGAIA